MKATSLKLAGVAMFAALSAPAGAAGGDTSLKYGERTLYVHVPPGCPRKGRDRS